MDGFDPADSPICGSKADRTMEVDVESDSLSIENVYEFLLNAEWPFAFSRIDAVYIWTRGGYQIGRNPHDYPIFLAVREDDRTQWQAFFEDRGIPAANERQPSSEIPGAIQIVLETRSELKIDYVEEHPVIPLGETIRYMQEHYAHFQSALAMLNRMYDELDLDVDY